MLELPPARTPGVPVQSASKMHKVPPEAPRIVARGSAERAGARSKQRARWHSRCHSESTGGGNIRAYGGQATAKHRVHLMTAVAEVKGERLRAKVRVFLI